MIYIIDVDQTICDSPGSDYLNSRPIPHRIQQINDLYDQGHEIHYWTARGGRSGQDWSEFTENQLRTWGCRFHTVRTGKPVYDVWIDDKAINDRDFFHENTADRT